MNTRKATYIVGFFCLVGLIAYILYAIAGFPVVTKTNDNKSKQILIYYDDITTNEIRILEGSTVWSIQEIYEKPIRFYNEHGKTGYDTLPYRIVVGFTQTNPAGCNVWNTLGIVNVQCTDGTTGNSQYPLKFLRDNPVERTAADKKKP